MIAPFVGWPLAQLWTMSSGFEDCVVPCGLNNVGEEEGEGGEGEGGEGKNKM